MGKNAGLGLNQGERPVFVYWGLFCILALGALLNRPDSRGRRIMFILLAAIPTTLMIGLRWKTGTDWVSYIEIFNYTKLFSLQQMLSRGDRGFNLLLWILHRFNSPFWGLNLACGLVFVTGLTAFCRRQPNPWLTFLVAFPYLVIVIGMSGDRQAIALGFLFIALNTFEEGKIYRFIILLFIAALFHGSVLLIVPIGIFSFTRNHLQRTLLLIVALGLGYYYFFGVFDVYSARYSKTIIQSSGTVYRFGMNGAAAATYLILRRKLGFTENEAKLWRNFSFATLAIGTLLVAFPSSTAIDRFLLYLFPLQFAVFGRLPTLASNRAQSGQLTLAVIAYAAAVQIVFLVFGTFASEFVPYRSILSL